MLYDQQYRVAQSREESMRMLERDASQSLLFDQIPDDTGDLLNITLDNRQLLMQFENTLRGRIEVEDPKTREPRYVQVFQPVMNEEGIQMVLQLLSGFINKNTILANMTLTQVKSFWKYMMKALIGLMANNTTRFQVDVGRRSVVVRDIGTIMFQAMSRSVGAQERRDVYGRTKSIEHFQKTQGTVGVQKNKFSLFGGTN